MSGNFEPIKQKGIFKNATKFFCFIKRSIDTWNGLKEEVIKAKNVHQLQEKLDKHKYRESTTRKFIMARSDKCSTTGTIFGTNNVSSIRK